MRRAQFVVVGITVVAASSAGPAALAGMLLSSGTTPLFGQAARYQEWFVRTDPVGAGQSASTGPDCDARSMVFSNGALYVGSSATLGAAGPTRYTPGPSGNLSSPTSPTFGFVLPGDRPRAGMNTRRLAINTSGAGYGAFGAGEAPTLVAISQASQEPFNPGDGYYTMRSTTPNATVSALLPGNGGNPFRPSAFAYARSADRFVTATNSSNPSVWDDQVVATAPSQIRFHMHNAAGIDFSTSTSFFQVDSNITLIVRGIAPVSGGFASQLLGQTLADSEVLLLLTRYEDGRSNPNELRVYSMSGTRLGASAIGLALLNDPSGFDSKPSSLAVDEAHGLLFIGEQQQGRIITFQVPAPSAVTLLAVGVVAVGRRRRA